MDKKEIRKHISSEIKIILAKNEYEKFKKLMNNVYWFAFGFGFGGLITLIFIF